MLRSGGCVRSGTTLLLMIFGFSVLLPIIIYQSCLFIHLISSAQYSSHLSTKHVCLALSQSIHSEPFIPSCIVFATSGEQRSEIPLIMSEGTSISPSLSTYSKSFSVPAGANSFGPHPHTPMGHTTMIVGLTDKEYEKLSYWDVDLDRKSTRLNSSHIATSRMPSSA